MLQMKSPRRIAFRRGEGYLVDNYPTVGALALTVAA